MTAGEPQTLEEALSPRWLTAALARRFPGIRVTAVTPGPVVSRVSTNARFRIECAGGIPKGLSPHLCLKGYFGPTGRASRQAGLPEAYFYRDLAAASRIRTLRSVYADVAPATQHGIVITEDVVAGGGTFLDCRSDYSPEQTAQSLDELAALHAATWMDQACSRAAWLAPRMARTLEIRGLPEIRCNFEGPNGDGVPADARDAHRLVGSYRRLAQDCALAAPWTVIHGDTHVGNLFLDGAGRPCFLDWQLVQRGPWYVDVGYHIASTLAVEDRRRYEADLLKHYLARLVAHGGPSLPGDEAWRGMRRGFVHGFFLWGITYVVQPELIAILLRRLGTAVADHDAFSAC